MKTTGAYKIWRIIYPIGIYYVVSSLAYFFLTLLLGAGEESYMLRQMLCAAATIPFVWMHYGQDRAARETVYGRRGIRPDARFFCTVAGALLAGASLGMAVNNVIAMTPLIEASAGFQSANQAFFAGGVVFELLGSCLVIPLAKAITDEIRRGSRIDTTTKLRRVIEDTLDFLPEKEKKDTIKKTCQRTFQALRIDVNQEFEVLYEFMEKLPGALRPGGRVAILTFHSGEDKLVKQALKEGYKSGIYSDYAKDVIRPSAQECAANGRARSTKMRWAVKA